MEVGFGWAFSGLLCGLPPINTLSLNVLLITKLSSEQPSESLFPSATKSERPRGTCKSGKKQELSISLLFIYSVQSLLLENLLLLRKYFLNLGLNKAF